MEPDYIPFLQIQVQLCQDDIGEPIFCIAKINQG